MTSRRSRTSTSSWTTSRPPPSSTAPCSASSRRPTPTARWTTRAWLASFARDAGFADGRVHLDVRFLKHPEIGLYLELFTYHHPKGDQTVHRRKTNDLGGVRHVAIEVTDAVAAHAFIRRQRQAYAERGLRIEILGGDHVPEEIAPYPYTFFYWIDPWGVQWEMEQGRPVGVAVTGITG